MRVIGARNVRESMSCLFLRSKVARGGNKNRAGQPILPRDIGPDLPLVSPAKESLPGYGTQVTGTLPGPYPLWAVPLDINLLQLHCRDNYKLPKVLTLTLTGKEPRESDDLAIGWTKTAAFQDNGRPHCAIVDGCYRTGTKVFRSPDDRSL